MILRSLLIVYAANPHSGEFSTKFYCMLRILMIKMLSIFRSRGVHRGFYKVFSQMSILESYAHISNAVWTRI